MAAIVVDMSELKGAAASVRQAFALDLPDDLVLWGFLQSRCGEADFFRTVRTGSNRYRLDLSEACLDTLAAVRAGELQRRHFADWQGPVSGKEGDGSCQ